VTSEEQRGQLSERLSELEDWLYMDGEGEAAPEFKARLKALKKEIEPIKKRAYVRWRGWDGGMEKGG
jgi:hypothetical protein